MKSVKVSCQLDFVIPYGDERVLSLVKDVYEFMFKHSEIIGFSQFMLDGPEDVDSND